MKLILNIFLSLLARGLLYILSVPLVILSTMIALCGGEPEIKFGGVITMSFVFGYNVNNLNEFAKLFYHAIEKADPGHFENAKTPSYLKTYLIYWN